MFSLTYRNKARVSNDHERISTRNRSVNCQNTNQNIRQVLGICIFQKQRAACFTAQNTANLDSISHLEDKHRILQYLSSLLVKNQGRREFLATSFCHCLIDTCTSDEPVHSWVHCEKPPRRRLHSNTNVTPQGTQERPPHSPKHLLNSLQVARNQMCGWINITVIIYFGQHSDPLLFFASSSWLRAHNLISISPLSPYHPLINHLSSLLLISHRITALCFATIFK